MPRIDQFIDLLHRRGGQALLASPGEPITLVVGDEARAVTARPLAENQLQALVAEIAGSRAGAPRFSYDAPTGPVDVEWTDGAGGSLTIRPAPSGSEPAPAASSHAASPPAGAVHVGADASDPRARVEALLRMLVEEGGSDLHLRVGQPPILRKDGELRRTDGPPLTASALDGMHVALMSDDDRERFHETGDADYAYEIPGLARFRANAALDREGPLAVFRVIPGEIPSCEQMGIGPELQKLCFLTKGLVVVTGPTGSGKSTTLAAMVDLMNRERKDHILTIEDPIEFVHPSRGCLVTHRQVGLHTRSFKAGLRAALREDPDIILIGELRDLETVAIAIETAETGHLVFGTLHTTTAASTVDRIIDQFPADQQAQIRVMLSESLKGVISQTLLRRIGGGRVAAREVLLTSTAVSNLIREGKTFQLPSIMQTSRKLGMVTLHDALIDLVDQGLVEPREAWVKAVDRGAMEQALKARGHTVEALAEA